jgi:hypothetical protein
VKKLKTWLTEWKERVDREARKQKILERKEARKNKNKKGTFPQGFTSWLPLVYISVHIDVFSSWDQL